jgi:hypothetical protein
MAKRREVKRKQAEARNALTPDSKRRKNREGRAA